MMLKIRRDPDKVILRTSSMSQKDSRPFFRALEKIPGGLNAFVAGNCSDNARWNTRQSARVSYLYTFSDLH